MSTFMLDLRYSWRMFWKNPGFTVVVVVALALGIGANSAIFSVVKEVLLRPLPFRDSARLVMISESHAAIGGAIPVTPANFLDWKNRSHVFEEIGFSRDAVATITGLGDPESVVAYRFSANFFQVLGVTPQLGRTFTAEEDQPGKNRVVVLSHTFWQSHFSGDKKVLGRRITLNGEPYEIIGVMPAGFNHPRIVQLWTPIAMAPNSWTNREAHILRLAGRLKPGVTLEQARRELKGIAAALRREHPETNSQTGVGLEPISEMYVGDVRLALIALLGSVGCLLLIACGNVANLLLARATVRRKEIAIRLALGASRIRLVRQLLTESVALSGAAGLLGLLLAWWTAGGLVKLFPNNIANLNIPKVEQIPVDSGVVLFTLVVSVMTGVIFGLVPALQSTAAQIGSSLKEGGRGTEGGSHRMRSIFVVSEVALSLVLLLGAGLMIRSFFYLQRGNLGFDPGNVLTMQVFLPSNKYSKPEKRRDFVNGVLPRIESLPGVKSVGLVNFLPLSGFQGDTSFTIPGRPAPRAGQEWLADNRIIAADYFRAMSIPVLRGRSFNQHDNERAPLVAIINQTLASRYWPGEDPVGKRLLIDPDGKTPTTEIVGVINDVKHDGLGEPSNAEIYRPFSQVPFPLFAFTVKTEGDPMQLAGVVRRQIWAVDKDQPVFRVISMEQAASESIALRRVSMILLGAFAALALVLAALGVYSVMSYSVGQRTHEIGIRMALGAESRDVFALVLRNGMRLAVIGMCLGVGAALALTPVLSSLLFNVKERDPLTFLAVSLFLLLIAFLANYIPARRATLVEPSVALRCE